MLSYGHWDISLVGEFEPDDHLGFVYQITHLETNKSYIGCKHLWKFNKRRKKIKASEWRNYCSSSNYLKPDIEKYGKDAFSFTILMLCPNKRDLYYNEAKLQMELGVLESDNYYNANIGGIRFFRPVSSYLDDKVMEKVRGINNFMYKGAFKITYKNKTYIEVYDKTVKQWCLDNGVDKSNLYKVVVGKRKSHKGIIKLEYINDIEKEKH